MKQDDLEAPQPVASAAAGGPARLMSKQIAVYYTNCSMVATSPAIFHFTSAGTCRPPTNKMRQQLAELYERHIYMAVEQAEDLAEILNQTIHAFKNQTEQLACFPLRHTGTLI